MPQLSLHGPLGALTLSEEDGAIVSLDWGWGRDQAETPLLLRARDWMHDYFDGAARDHDLPLRPFGDTPYRRRIWAALRAIPRGETLTYAGMAARVGGSARSVGGACGANLLPILIPCHRVVGTAALGGYSAGEGPETKRALLALERASRSAA